MRSEVDFSNPMLWAVLIGWILSVTLHEFAHGLVAYLGGDYTIRQRGGLTLNPFQYIHPFNSIILPTIFLMMGGIPLPGGATYIRRDLLRSRFWDSATSAAGPAANLLLFLIFAYAIRPDTGWIDRSQRVHEWTASQVFVAAMAYLQLLSVLLNLLPIPPLDGFGIIQPFLSRSLQMRLMTPQLNTVVMVVFFLLLMSGVLFRFLQPVIGWGADLVGVPYEYLAGGLVLALYGRA